MEAGSSGESQQAEACMNKVYEGLLQVHTPCKDSLLSWGRCHHGFVQHPAQQVLIRPLGDARRQRREPGQCLSRWLLCVNGEEMQEKASSRQGGVSARPADQGCGKGSVSLHGCGVQTG